MSFEEFEDSTAYIEIECQAYYNDSFEEKEEDKIYIKIDYKYEEPNNENARIAMKNLSKIRKLPDEYIPKEELKILKELIKFFNPTGEIPIKYFGGYGHEILARDFAHLLEPTPEKTIHLLAVQFYDYENWRIIVSVIQNYIRYHFLNDKTPHKICNFGEKCNKKNSCKFIHA